MLQKESILEITDNTGAKKALMIGKIGDRKRTASIGDIIIVSIQESIPTSSIKKGEVVKAVIVRTKYPIKRTDGSYIRFDKNSCVIIDPETKNPKGSRIFGPVARELRQKKFIKIISLASEVL